MRLPIQCALTYPERLPGASVPRLDLRMIGNLTFGIPDARKYPCLGLALDAGRRGGTYPAVLGAADEIAVSNFLAGHISYISIAHVIEDTLSAHSGNSNPSLDQVLEADSWARRFAEGRVKSGSKR